jgi:hypothetical protein
MKTRIIERKRNFDVKKFVPQFGIRFLFFTIWRDFKYEFGEAYLSGGWVSHEFNTRVKAEVFIKNH